MKKVIVTGLTSYIGNSFEEWIKIKNENAPEEEQIEVTKLSLRNAAWQKEDWSGYDAILHVAGLAHVDVRETDEATRQKYMKINRDLTIAAADKARRDGVSQFIYMSSIIVYGDSSAIGQEKIIKRDTKPEPGSFYGDSKLQAELGIKPLETEDFHISIIRTPMVFGEGSKGNFPRLADLVRKTPLFPKVENKRSMIYIYNLTELIRQLILTDRSGMFYPQNKELLSTCELIRLIADAYGKKVHFAGGMKGLLKLGAKVSGSVNKLFGSLAYEEDMSLCGIDYRVFSAEDAVRRSVGSK